MCLRCKKGNKTSHNKFLPLVLCLRCKTGNNNSHNKLLLLYDSGRGILFEYVGQLVSPFKAFSQRQKKFTLLYGYKSDNKDYYYINIQVTVEEQNFLIKTKSFV